MRTGARFAPTVGALLALAVTTASAQSSSTATGQVVDASGKTVGTAQLAQVAGGVRVTARLQGLPPGRRGIHLHDVGRCEGPSFSTAGEHFNPSGRQHGPLNPAGAHAGDLPNLEVGADGVGSVDVVAPGARLGPGEGTLLDANGSALVVHTNADDLRSDPSGNSGPRIACGVVLAQSTAAPAAPTAAVPGRAPTQLPRTGGAGYTGPALLGVVGLAAGVLLRRRPPARTRPRAPSSSLPR